METMMSWREVTNLQPDLLREAQEWAFEVYLWFFKDKKLRREVAIEQTSLALGLSPRKARSLLGLDAGVAIRPNEYESLGTAFVEHLAEQRTELARRSEATGKRCSDIKRRIAEHLGERERELIRQSEAETKQRAEIKQQEVDSECFGQLSLVFSIGDGRGLLSESLGTDGHISTPNVAR